MPSGDALCRKCHAGPAEEGDSWCAICSGSQLLGESARNRFHSRAHHALCGELVRQTARQVQAVVKLDRQVQGEVCSLSDRLRNAKQQLSEVTNQIKKSAAAKSKAEQPVARSERFAPSEGHPDRSKEAPRSPSRPPPHPPPVREERERSRSRPRGEKKKTKKKNKGSRGRRGGARHQQNFPVPSTCRSRAVEPIDLGRRSRHHSGRR